MTICTQSRSLLIFSLLFIIPSGYAIDDWQFPPATPESQGISSEALQELSAIVDGYLNDDLIVGAELLVIKNRKTVFHQGYGWLDRERRIPMQPNTIFNIRSMSKPITGTAAQILIDEGQLAPDDSAAKYLPGFDNDRSRDITLRLLLTHRSGLPLTIHTGLNDFPNLFDMANETGRLGPQFGIDSKFWYSDAGTECVGAIVERASGLLLNQFLTDRIIEPLRMNDSFSYTAGPPSDPRWDRVASLYVQTANGWIKYKEYENEPWYPFAWGSQTMYCTPMDYARFIAMWMDKGMAPNGRLLSEEAVERTLTPVSIMSQLGSDSPAPTGFPGLKPCYGQLSVLYMPMEDPLNSKPVVVSHSGSDGTIAWGWPDEDLMVMYFTQSRGGFTALRMEYEVYRLLVNPDFAPDVPEELQEYIGDYVLKLPGQSDLIFKITTFNGTLALDHPRILIMELEGSSNQSRWRSKSFTSISVRFERDANGIINGMRYFEGGQSFLLPKVEPTSVNDWKLMR